MTDLAGEDRARLILTALHGMPPEQVVDVGVTAGDALTVMTTPPTPPGVVHDPAVTYGTAGENGRPLTMHLYRAENPEEKRPGVVFVHGGGFHEGFPEMLIRYANHLAAEGYVTACIRYRLVGEATWPAAVEDAKCAVRWLRANAGAIGLDPDRIAVAGNSAGGHIAAMVSTTPGLFEGSGGNESVSSAVSAAVLLYPVLSLRRRDLEEVVKPIVDALLGCEEAPDEVAAPASPSTYVDNAPPTLTFTGELDPLIAPRHAVAYHARLDELGVPNRLHVIEGVGHSFDYAVPRWEDCFREMRAFLAEQLDHATAGEQPDDAGQGIVR